MNPAIKAKWIAALRSGEYQQGMKRLRTGDKFCCLGVLCDLAARDGIGSWTSEGFVVDGLLAGGLPPGPVCRYASTRSATHSDLCCMNDTGSSFAEIANWIEAHL